MLNIEFKREKEIASIEGKYRKCIVYRQNVLGEKESSIAYIQAEDFFSFFL